MDEIFEDKQNGENAKSHEKERIDELIFWDDLEKPTENHIYHFHPVAFVDNLMQSAQLITLEMLNAVNPNGARGLHLEILPYLNENAHRYNIIEPREIAHFLS